MKLKLHANYFSFKLSKLDTYCHKRIVEWSFGYGKLFYSFWPVKSSGDEIKCNENPS